MSLRIPAAVRRLAPVSRLKRIIQSLDLSRLDQRAIQGDAGELQCAAQIRRIGPQCHIANPVVPSSSHSLTESDHVILYGGAVFVLEVKNYKGTLVRSDQPGKLQQQKFDRWGRIRECKLVADPVVQATAFARHLKRHLAVKADPRFWHSTFFPIGVFTRTIDLGTLHSFENGYIYDDELLAYVDQHKNPRFVSSSSSWLVKGLEVLPRLDVVVQRDGQRFTGLLRGTGLRLRSWPDGEDVDYGWQDFSFATLSRGIFSAADSVHLTLRNGGDKKLTATVKGRIQLEAFRGKREGEVRKFYLRNVTAIQPSPVVQHPLAESTAHIKLKKRKLLFPVIAVAAALAAVAVVTLLIWAARPARPARIVDIVNGRPALSPKRPDLAAPTVNNSRIKTHRPASGDWKKLGAQPIPPKVLPQGALPTAPLSLEQYARLLFAGPMAPVIIAARLGATPAQMAAVFLLSLALCLLPSLVAAVRKKRRAWLFFLCNIFLGGNLIGWLVLMFFAVRKSDGRPVRCAPRAIGVAYIEPISRKP